MSESEDTWVRRVREAAAGRPVLGIMGGGRSTDVDIGAARVLGRLAAAAGWAVLTGGGPGIMEAACRGAREAGGITIGILPGTAPTESYPNPAVTVALFTGLGPFDPETGDPGRNRINILASDVVAAFPGAAGTNSEVRLAVAHGKPLVLVGWKIDALLPATRDRLRDRGTRPAEVKTSEDALAWIQEQI